MKGGCVFDTTTSMTGIWSGEITRVELWIDREFLWPACRHHVFELTLRAVWAVLFEKSNNPERDNF